MSDLGPWTPLKRKRPPEFEAVIFRWIYPNGNSGNAVGYRQGRRYEIEWTDDHPQQDDLVLWMPFPETPEAALSTAKQGGES